MLQKIILRTISLILVTIFFLDQSAFARVDFDQMNSNLSAKSSLGLNDLKERVLFLAGGDIEQVRLDNSKSFYQQKNISEKPDRVFQFVLRHLFSKTPSFILKHDMFEEYKRDFIRTFGFNKIFWKFVFFMFLAFLATNLALTFSDVSTNGFYYQGLGLSITDIFFKVYMTIKLVLKASLDYWQLNFLYMAFWTFMSERKLNRFDINYHEKRIGMEKRRFQDDLMLFVIIFAYTLIRVALTDKTLNFELFIDYLIGLSVFTFVGVAGEYQKHYDNPPPILLVKNTLNRISLKYAPPIFPLKKMASQETLFYRAV